MSIGSSNSFDQFSPQGMATFTLGLAGLPREEIVKAKRLYILDGVTRYEAMVQQVRVFGAIQILFALIPCFWPILILQRVSLNASLKSAKQLIQNALEVWRDDLGEHYDDLCNRLDPGANLYR